MHAMYSTQPSEKTAGGAAFAHSCAISVASARATVAQNEVPTTELSMGEAKQELPTAFSNFIRLFNQQRNSFMTFFGGGSNGEGTTIKVGIKGQQTTTSSSLSRSPKAAEMPVDVSPCFATSVNSTAVAAASAATAPPCDFSGRHSVEVFFPCCAVPGVFSAADRDLELQAARMEVQNESLMGTQTKTWTDSSESIEAGSAAVAGTATTDGTTKAAASPALFTHVHRLRPTQFFVPTLCEVCRRALLDIEVWPLLSRTGASSSSSSTSMSFLSGFLLSPTSGTADLPPPGDSVSVPKVGKLDGSSSSAAKVNAVPSVQQPFLGFGTDGYHCEVCDLALHRQCLRNLRETQMCEVLAPAAHRMPEEENEVNKEKEKRTKDNNSNSRGSGSFIWDNVKGLLNNYLDPNGGSYSRRDANVKFVLSGVFALLDTVASRYPNLTPLTFIKRQQVIQDLSKSHQELYLGCTSSLNDSQLLTSITWDEFRESEQMRTSGQCNKQAEQERCTCDDGGDGEASQQLLPTAPAFTREMHPLKMNTSVMSQLTSRLVGTTSGAVKKDSSNGCIRNAKNNNSATTAANSTASSFNSFLPEFAKLKTEELRGADATFPVQLLLWRALRYATAVYGEVYRRGSLSSTVSAALLFTVKRGSVDVSKEANDAAVTGLLELPPCALRLSRWAAKATEPSYVLLVDHRLGHIVVSFRGTLNAFDIMTDLAAVGIPFCGGHAHQGVAHVVNAIFDRRSSQYAKKAPKQPPTKYDTATAADTAASATSASLSEKVGVEMKEVKNGSGKVKVVLEPYSLQTLETPDGLLDGLEQLGSDYPTYTILITGHSLGGAVAVLFATRLHHDRVFPESLLRRLHVIAFAPMPTLSLPAASCFDAVSCDLADGGFDNLLSTSRAATQQENPKEQQQQGMSTHGNHQHNLSAASTSYMSSEGTDEPIRQACFPVWSVVNGFDCVPRLQVNTIDRLLRQIAGPQIETPLEEIGKQQQQLSTSFSLSSSASSSRASAALLRQRCRGEGRDSAWVDAGADQGAVEVKDMPSTAMPGTEATESGETASSRFKTAKTGQMVSPSLSSSEKRTKCTVTDACTPSTATCGAAGSDPVKMADSTEISASIVAKRSGGTVYVKSAQSFSICESSKQKQSSKNDEPAWASDARVGLGESEAEEQDMVVKDARRGANKESALPASSELAGSIAVAAAAGITAFRTADETDSVPHTTASHGEHVLSHELHHPGRVLLLTFPWDVARNRLVDVPRGHPVMHELFLMKYMLLQHSVDAYCGSLAEVHNQTSGERDSKRR